MWRQHRNAEANLLTIVDRVAYGREVGQLEAVWPEMERVADPESAEWLGAQPNQMRKSRQRHRRCPRDSSRPPIVPGMNGGSCYDSTRTISRRIGEFMHAGGTNEELLSASVWRERAAHQPSNSPGYPSSRRKNCSCSGPITKHSCRSMWRTAASCRLRRNWNSMSADDMLWILAATDPSAAFRAWARRQQPSDLFDTDLDSATPIDLDPLRRYDLQATFLHRIRRRARILAQLRSNLQRPVWGRQALEWRLRGLVGVEPLADRLVREFAIADGAADEALLTLADFLIVLREVDYQPSDGSLPKAEFERIFRPFLIRFGGTSSGNRSTSIAIACPKT